MKLNIGDWVEIIDERFLEFFTNSESTYSKIDGMWNGVELGADTRFSTRCASKIDVEIDRSYQRKYYDKSEMRYWVRVRNSDHLFNSKQIRKLTEKEVNTIIPILEILKS